MPLAEGEWNLSYGARGILPAADFTFGTFRSGFYLLEPYEITYADTDAGDTPMPRTDAIRFGEDFRAQATLTFELGVDTVGGPALSRHGRNLDAVSALEQAWDAESVRRWSGKTAVLRTMQGGRARRWYGRPRKCAPSGSRLTRQGYTPVVATFACQESHSYDDVEKSVRVDLQPPPHRGLRGPLKAPVTMTGQSSAVVRGGLDVRGTKPTWPVLTIRGPLSQPQIELVGHWTVALDLTLGPNDSVTIDTRPWARTVLRNGSGSVAGALTWGSPRMENMRLPVGPQSLVLRGVDDTGSAFLTASWRDAYAYL
ncbi:hypothetical protein [Streptomyces virginiae]|uniref:hypothetical protein n=1 Tax=Streptomyces virginiae TaxID=1961 RepID=UPI00366953B3